MGRPTNTEQRRQQIVEAMITVMAQRGYEAASIARIAAAAGLTPGLVHYHFKSKQQILLALLDLLVARHGEVLDQNLSAAGARPVDRLEAFIHCHLALGASSDPDALACWVLLCGEALRQPEVGQAYGAAMERLAALLRKIIGDGVRGEDFVCDHVGAAAGALLATIQGYFVLAATSRELIPRGSAARSTRAMAAGLLQVDMEGRVTTTGRQRGQGGDR